MVSKNYEIECAIVELEKELIDLKRVKQHQNNSAAALGNELNNAQNQLEEEEEKMDEGEAINGKSPNGTENTNSDESN